MVLSFIKMYNRAAPEAMGTETQEVPSEHKEVFFSL